MKFSILHPTARLKVYPSFPYGWWDAAHHAFMMCEKPQEVEYLLIVHNSDLPDLWKQLSRHAPEAWGRFSIVQNSDRNLLVYQCNAGLRAASGEIILFLEDDLFAPQGWDTKLAEAAGDTSIPQALHCLTGSPRDNELFLPTCYTRSLGELIGPYCPEYESMFMDNECTAKQKQLGRVLETGLVFQHRH